MADDKTIDQEIGLSNEEYDEEEILLSHTIDPQTETPANTDTSSIGLKGVDGIVNISYDSEASGGNANDTYLGFSLVNGMILENIGDDPGPTPPGPTPPRAEWVKKILQNLNTTDYRVWYLKSHDKHCIPFDTCRGFMYWDFDNALLFFIELNKYEQTYVNQKYPIAINVVGFDSILQIEGYYNMRDEKS